LTVGRVPGPGDTDREAPAQDGLQVTAKWLVEARQQGSRIGVALSASLTNEDVFAWARLATELGASVYLLPRAGWEGDSLLRTNDRDANTTGARAILEAIYGDFADAAALQRDASGLGLLLLVDNDAAAPDVLVDALTNIERFVAFTDLPDGLSEVADVVVPLTQLHQREGTVTNTAGWVQRLGAPLKPAVTTVAPHVAAAFLAGAALDVSLDFTDKTKPVDLFERLAGVVPAFKHLTYKALASHGRGLTHGGELAPAREHIAGTAQWEPDPVGPTYKRPFQLRRGA
jgi:NADH-quinone oxidoreductase subunit G